MALSASTRLVCLGCGDDSCTRERVTDLAAFWQLYRHAFAYAEPRGEEVADAYAVHFASLYWDDEEPRSHPAAFWDWDLHQPRAERHGPRA